MTIFKTVPNATSSYLVPTRDMTTIIVHCVRKKIRPNVFL